MLPDLSSLSGGSAYWALMAIKALAALGFISVANAVILYAS